MNKDKIRMYVFEYNENNGKYSRFENYEDDSLLF